MAYEEYYGRSGITDPKTIAMLRRRKMAEDLMKTGSDTSPAATPLVGLSRVLQGLVGGYTAGMADKDASDASAATDAERQAAMAQAQALIDGAGGGGGGAMPAMVQPQTPAPTGDTYGRILAAESGGSMQPGIYGDGGAAAGPGQVHAAALADVNRANGTNYTHEQLAAQPEVGKQVGQAYYKQLLDMFGGDERKATAAYNAGPGRVKAAEAQYGAEWEKGLPTATREQYLPKVFGAPSAAPQAGAPPQPDSMAYAKRLIGQAAQFAQSPDPRIRALAGPLEKNAQLALTQAERDQSRTFQRDTLAIQQAEAQRVRDEARGYDAQKAAEERGYKAIPPEAVFRNLTDKVTKGTATPAEEDEFFGAAANWTRTTVNPQTGEVIAGRDLAPRWFQALKAIKARNAASTAPAVATTPEAAAPSERPLTDIGGVNVSKAGTTKEPPLPVVTGTLGNADALRRVMQARESIDKYPNAVGFGNYALPGPSRDIVDPGGVEARARLADLSSMIVHDRSGAAVSAMEFPRLKPFLPEPTDTPTTVRKKLVKMEEELRNILTDQYSTFGPKAGYRALPAVEDVLKLKAGQGGGNPAASLPPGFKVIE